MIRANRFARIALRIARATKLPENLSSKEFWTATAFSSFPLFRKTPVSVKFLSAILGPETSAPILWTPGKNALYLQEKPMSVKFLVRGGGVFWVWGGVGGVPILFLWARGFFWLVEVQLWCGGQHRLPLRRLVSPVLWVPPCQRGTCFQNVFTQRSC